MNSVLSDTPLVEFSSMAAMHHALEQPAPNRSSSSMTHLNPSLLSCKVTRSKEECPQSHLVGVLDCCQSPNSVCLQHAGDCSLPANRFQPKWELQLFPARACVSLDWLMMGSPDSVASNPSGCFRNDWQQTAEIRLQARPAELPEPRPDLLPAVQPSPSTRVTEQWGIEPPCSGKNCPCRVHVLESLPGMSI